MGWRARSAANSRCHRRPVGVDTSSRTAPAWQSEAPGVQLANAFPHKVRVRSSSLPLRTGQEFGPSPNPTVHIQGVGHAGRVPENRRTVVVHGGPRSTSSERVGSLRRGSTGRGSKTLFGAAPCHRAARIVQTVDHLDSAEWIAHIDLGGPTAAAVLAGTALVLSATECGAVCGRQASPHTLYLSGMTGRIGAKGQVVIPKALRDQALLQPGDVVDFKLRDKEIVLVARRSPARLGGRFSKTGMAARLLEDRMIEPR
jgi:AbrB family looped-hinge helix DNA binding protein